MVLSRKMGRGHFCEGVFVLEIMHSFACIARGSADTV